MMYRRNTHTTEIGINGTIYHVPTSYFCLFTGQVMVHPLRAPSGIVFERSAILAWLKKGSKTCPVTGEPMRDSDLVPNRHLEHQLLLWKKNNGVPTEKGTTKINTLEPKPAGSAEPSSSKEVKINGIFYCVPCSYICPITRHIMIHPLLAPSGMNYEGSTILSWLKKGCETCTVEHVRA
jgi:hypothetical protein